MLCRTAAVFWAITKADSMGQGGREGSLEFWTGDLSGIWAIVI